MLKYFMLILILASSLVIASKLDDSCLKALPCDPANKNNRMCALIDLEIVSDNPIYAVGDAFYYNLTLKNTGVDVINTTINVTSDPRDMLESDANGKTFSINLEKGQSESYPLSQKDKGEEKRMYTFKHLGEHSLLITVDQARRIQFVECKTFQGEPKRKISTDFYLKTFGVAASDQERKWSRADTLALWGIIIAIAIPIISTITSWIRKRHARVHHSKAGRRSKKKRS
ncbi:MAG: hypothetical protein AABX70_07995 [Nanoarchaeota archaeon]